MKSRMTLIKFYINYYTPTKKLQRNLFEWKKIECYEEQINSGYIILPISFFIELSGGEFYKIEGKIPFNFCCNYYGYSTLNGFCMDPHFFINVENKEVYYRFFGGERNPKEMKNIINKI